MRGGRGREREAVSLTRSDGARRRRPRGDRAVTFFCHALTGPIGRPRRAVRWRAAGARGDETLVRTLSQASLIFENSGGPARAMCSVFLAALVLYLRPGVPGAALPPSRSTINYCAENAELLTHGGPSLVRAPCSIGRLGTASVLEGKHHGAASPVLSRREGCRERSPSCAEKTRAGATDPHPSKISRRSRSDWAACRTLGSRSSLFHPSRVSNHHNESSPCLMASSVDGRRQGHRRPL